MERIEEIKRFAGQIAENIVDNPSKEDIKNIVIDSIKWADSHPKDGLVDLEKVCDWWEPRIECYAGYYQGGDLMRYFREEIIKQRIEL